MEREKLKRRERDFKNGKGRHGGERKKKIYFSRCRSVTIEIDKTNIYLQV